MYRDYLERAIAASSTLLFSEILEVELAEACAKAAGGGHHAQRDRMLGQRRDILGQVIGAWNSLLDQTEYLRLPIRETHAAQGWEHAYALAIDLLGNYAIRMKDALHAASAILLAAPLLTDDRDYARLPTRLLLIVTDPGQVDAMRDARSA
jgi:predicted nucleic acid-binding protein